MHKKYQEPYQVFVQWNHNSGFSIRLSLVRITAYFLYNFGTKVSKDDPKVLASINITKYLLNLKIMDLNSSRHNQRVCKCDLGSISLLQWNQMLVSLSQKSKAYIYFIHSVFGTLIVSMIGRVLLLENAAQVLRSLFLLEYFQPLPNN